MRFHSSVAINLLVLLSACSNETATSEDPATPPGELAAGKSDRWATVEGDHAKAIYDAMQVEGMFNGAYHTNKEAQGELSCAFRDLSDDSRHYFCHMEGVLDIDGEPARVLYDDFDVDPVDDGYYTTKRDSGRLLCSMVTPWGGELSYSCNFVTPALLIDGDLAQVVYDAFQVEGEFNGAYHTTKKAYDELTCSMGAAWGASELDYTCGMGEMAKLLALDGVDAQRLYDALRVEGEHNGAYHTHKVVSGELVCQMVTPWGGELSYDCFIN